MEYRKFFAATVLAAWPAAAQATQCPDNAYSLAPDETTGLTCECPANTSTAAYLYGTGRYTADSSICLAAVHDGKTKLEAGGTVTVFTGAGWKTPRTNMEKEIPLQHWHQNDPGTIPNLLQTGQGSPTGICVNEGAALGKQFENQVIHCDAGPRVVRSRRLWALVRTLPGATTTPAPRWSRPTDTVDGATRAAVWVSCASSSEIRDTMNILQR